jgi:formate dehydrogenase subunit delta
MTDERLLEMLSAIADFHRAYPHDEAVAGIADHIRAFWDPRMRNALAAALARGAPGLDPLAREAALQVVEGSSRNAA